MHLRTWRNPVDAQRRERCCWRFKSSRPHRDCRYGATGRRGGLKNRKLWVRIPLPALNFVGVAQMEERERAMLEAGSSNLLAHFKLVV